MNEQDLLTELLKDYATLPTDDDNDEAEEVVLEEETALITPTAEAYADEEVQEAQDEEEQLLISPEDVTDDFPVQEEEDVAEELPVLSVAEEIPEDAADEEDEEIVIVPEEAVPAEPEIKVSHMEAPTQVVNLTETVEQESEEEEDPFDGQMTMEDFAEPAPEEEAQEAETVAAEEISWEEQLEQTRREKIRDFQIQKNREDTDFRYGDEEAPDEVEAALPTEQEEPEQESGRTRFTGDYTDQEQAADVAAELAHRHRSMRFRLWLVAAAELLLLWSEASVRTNGGAPTATPSVFLWVNLIGYTAAMALLFPMLRDGFVALFRLKPNGETVPAVVGSVVWIHTVLQWLRLSEVEAGNAPLLTALGGLVLFLCGIGKLLRVARIRRNFALVGAEGDKVAASIVQDERTAIEIGRRAVATGVPRVAYFRPVKFLDDFLANSYMDDRYDTLLKRYIPVAFGLAVVAGTLYGALVTGFWEALTLFTMLVCILLPAASLALNIPLSRECKRQLEQGNMLCGFAAAERFGNIHGVALDVSDLYLHDSVVLHGIRTFGSTRIDEAIMDAAAVAICTEGPLAGLFLRIIEQKTEILQAVDNLVFEQDMGFSGWVGGRRVLVGNRKLLENHGVDTPSGDYERKYKKDGRELVYLSVAGELSAMFVISYATDEDVENALHDLQDADVSLLVRSCDPNVTEESLCAGFRLDDFYLDLLTASAGRLYDHLRHRDEDRESAGAAVDGTAEGISRLLTGCKRLRRRGITAMILQLVGALLGGIICVSAVLSGGAMGAMLPIILVLACTVITAISSWF